MSWVLIAGAVWVLVATATAFLPMRRQYAPGMALLICAPLLIGGIWWVHGWMWGVAALAGFLSMFRRPLVYFWGRLNGAPAMRPEDFE
ncbi:hypothetical protein ATO6_16275 [Oceanicola sp. 22II-s10i]|uniref:DUF2484 family protein n=1 Tax=Oceanicola sp. 22II-s10i TaxID=1317116 RepID=UPI000B528882|nr:DUF2484 family protein [Oceanicola sp. 22II-s10i]OWU83962.1 hypothetical protein ATO6_16275 [Oceanicola sp. 22II-s10i]